MAATKLDFSDSTKAGAYLHSSLNQFENAFDTLNRAAGSLQRTITGSDPSDPTNYVGMATALGAADGATAMAIYNELQAFLFKLNTDSSVDTVNTAIRQALSKLR